LASDRVDVDDRAQIGAGRLVPHLLDRGGHASTRGVIERLDRLPSVGEDLAGRLAHGDGDWFVFALGAPVYLVFDGSEYVEPERIAAAEIADRVGPRGDRLRLRRLDQVGAHPADLERNDAEQVVFH